MLIESNRYAKVVQIVIQYFYTESNTIKLGIIFK